MKHIEYDDRTGGSLHAGEGLFLQKVAGINGKSMQSGEMSPA